MSLLVFDRVKLTYGKGRTAVQALAGISLRIETGEFVALRGVSGSGKTTLVNLAAGFLRPDSGSILLAGQDLTGLDEKRIAALRRQHIGFVFQMWNLLPTLTARENILLPLILNDRPADETRLKQLLELAGLRARADAFPAELSGGEQQRVAVLRALVHRPALVLLDEPTSCLDSANAAQCLNLLERCRDEAGTAFVLATHDESIAARADREIVLRDGVILRNEP